MGVVAIHTTPLLVSQSWCVPGQNDWLGFDPDISWTIDKHVSVEQKTMPITVDSNSLCTVPYLIALLHHFAGPKLRVEDKGGMCLGRQM